MTASMAHAPLSWPVFLEYAREPDSILQSPASALEMGLSYGFQNSVWLRFIFRLHRSSLPLFAGVCGGVTVTHTKGFL